MQVTEAIEARQRATVSSQVKTNSGLRPCFGVLRPRELGLMLGVTPRLKIALRLSRQSYAIPLRVGLGYGRRSEVGEAR